MKRSIERVANFYLTLTLEEANALVEALSRDSVLTSDEQEAVDRFLVEAKLLAADAQR